jgi:ABC-type Fe3+-siderophore transport system permease subunit
VSNTSITYLVIACSAVFGLAAFLGLIVAPAWRSYSRPWERVAAVFLSLYVLATFVGVGVVLGATVLWYSDRL